MTAAARSRPSSAASAYLATAAMLDREADQLWYTLDALTERVTALRAEARRYRALSEAAEDAAVAAEWWGPGVTAVLEEVGV